MLLLDRVRHDDQEEVEILRLLGLIKLPALGVLAAYVLRVVVVDGLLESLDAGLVAQLDDVAIVDVDVEVTLLRELIEAIVEVLAMLHVLLEAEDGPLFEMDRLVYDGAKDLRVVERARCQLLR